MAQRTKDWLFRPPIFLVMINLMFAGNMTYAGHPGPAPRWYQACLGVAILSFIAREVYLAFRGIQLRANGSAWVPEITKDAPQTVAGKSILMTAMAFMAVAFFTEDHVPTPFIKLHLLAIFVSVVLFIIGERSTTTERTEETLALNTRT